MTSWDETVLDQGFSYPLKTARSAYFFDSLRRKQTHVFIWYSS